MTTESAPQYRPAAWATNLATIGLALACLFGAFLTTVYLVGAVGGGHEVTAHQTVPLDEVSALPTEVVRPAEVPVTLRVRDASPKQIGLAAARDLTAFAIFLPILWLIRQILRSARDGDPFVDKNVQRLRAIGFVLVIGAPVGQIAAHFFDSGLASTTPVGELGSTFSLPLGGPLAGLGVFVLAEVFARGARLRADVAGTV